MSMQLNLTTQQINEIRNRVGVNAKGDLIAANSWKGYEYISSLIKNNNQIDADTKLWFERAAEINKNDPNSSANVYIRSVTEYSLKWQGENYSPTQIQDTSNNIGFNVLTDIVNRGGIDQIKEIVDKDIKVAIGKQGIGGWGGAFYYWDRVITWDNQTRTVGEHIQANPAEYEKFIAVNAAAMDQTYAKEFAGSVSNNEFFDSLVLAWKSGVPTSVSTEIAARALATSPKGSYAGDPNNIGGIIYNPSTGKWMIKSTDGVFSPPIAVTDPATIKKLNDIRTVRLDKAEISKFRSGDDAFKLGPNGLNMNDIKSILDTEYLFKQQYHLGNFNYQAYRYASQNISDTLMYNNGGFKPVSHYGQNNNGFTGGFTPIGAFYESASAGYDGAGSIADKTFVILHASGVKMSVKSLTDLDSNKDGKLSGLELSSLYKWSDINEDGIEQAGEVAKLNTEIRATDYAIRTAGNGKAPAPHASRIDHLPIFMYRSSAAQNPSK